MDVDGDVGGLFVAHAVLEGVLDQRDEEQRRNRGRRGSVGQRDKEPHVARQANAHQLDVVAQEVNLGRERDGGAAAVVEHVAQHAAQVVDGLLGTGRVELDERVDVVERVEEEVGVQLALEVLQLGLGVAVLQLLAGRLGAVPAARHPDGDPHADNQRVERGVAQEEAHAVLPRTVGGRVVPRVGRQHVAEEQVDAHHDQQDEQQVREGEAAAAPGGEVAVDEHEVVRVEDQHERERHQQEANVLRTGHERAVRTGEEERHPEDDGPGGQVDEPCGVFRLYGVHGMQR